MANVFLYSDNGWSADHTDYFNKMRSWRTSRPTELDVRSFTTSLRRQPAKQWYKGQQRRSPPTRFSRWNSCRYCGDTISLEDVKETKPLLSNSQLHTTNQGADGSRANQEEGSQAAEQLPKYSRLSCGLGCPCGLLSSPLPRASHRIRVFFRLSRSRLETRPVHR